MKVTRPKGTRDVFGDEMKMWQYIEGKIRDICASYQVNEIRTPVFEATNLFERGVGDETDIVNKEMYTFLDKGGRSITLRPELTAGVVRAYIENGMSSMASPLKLWYIGNLYRYEKMQKGRYREFSQFGLEIFGTDSYLADIEVISLSYALFKELGLADKLTLSVNSIGCSKCRGEYIKKLKAYVKPRLDHMCETCKVRYEKNPMRIIDCKEERCREQLKEVPYITDCLCEECSTDFEKVKTMLDQIGIPYVIDKTIVRGLDYYNKTVFEFISKDFNIAAGGGGRYDTLVSILDGPETPAVGIALGMDRIILLLEEYGLVKDITKPLSIYFAVMEESAYAQTRVVATKLREMGYVVDLDIAQRSFKAQLKYANKLQAKYVGIIGEEEVKDNTCMVKNMDNGEQTRIPFTAEDIIKIIK